MLKKFRKNKGEERAAAAPASRSADLGSRESLSVFEQVRAARKRFVGSKADLSELLKSGSFPRYVRDVLPEPIRVGCRVRPLSDEETWLNEAPCTSCSADRRHLTIRTGEQDKRTFRFNHVWDTASSQADVFDSAVLPMLPSVFDGINVAVLAFGPRRSGKTYTMAPPTQHDATDASWGVTARVALWCIREAQQRHSEQHCQVYVRASVLTAADDNVWDVISGASKPVRVLQVGVCGHVCMCEDMCVDLCIDVCIDMRGSCRM